MSYQNIPLLALTLTLTGTVAVNRFVTQAVAQAGAGANTLGEARSAGVSGDKITVDMLGTAICEAGAAVTVGSSLGVDANGRAIIWSSGAKVGVALDAASAAGQMIEVFLIPNVS